MSTAYNLYMSNYKKARLQKFEENLVLEKHEIY